MNIQNRQYLSVITTTGADCHVSVSYEEKGMGRGHPRNQVTVITAAVSTPGTAILGKSADATSGAAPDSTGIGFEVSNITINNIDTISQTVTVCLVSTDDAGTQTVIQLYKETIAAGQQLVYEAGSAAWSLATHNVLGIWNTMTVAVAVANSGNNVLADVTGLTFPVVAGNVYEFYGVLAYTSAASTTGLRVVTNGPAITNLSGWSKYPIDATTETTNGFTAHGVPAAGNGDTLTAGGVARIGGFFKPSADGTLAIQFANDVNASAVTVLAGSTLMVRRTL